MGRIFQKYLLQAREIKEIWKSMGKPGFQNGMDRHEQKRKAETDGLMDILDPLGGRLPDEILLSVFRHLPIHIVYGLGEQEHPTGMIAVCKRGSLSSKLRNQAFFGTERAFLEKSDFCKRTKYDALAVHGIYAWS